MAGGLDESEDVKSATAPLDEFFVFPPDNRPDVPHDHFDLEIPVIDLSPVLELEMLKKEFSDLKGKGKKRSLDLEEQIEACEAAKAVVQGEIRAACEEYGFFQIVNHGVSPSVLKQLVEGSQHIFGLPVEEKLKVESAFTPVLKSGYGPMTRVTRFSMIGKSHIWNEGFDLESPEILNPGRIEEITHTLWPGDPEQGTLGVQFRSASEECGKQLSAVTLRLLYMMAGSLGLPEESLEGLLGPDFQNKQVYARVRINHYPKCAEPEKTWGFPSHTDSSIITVLHQDAVGGLQVRFKDGSWHGVRPLDDALIINAGNFLQVWTNRRFLSAEHRAVTNGKAPRISVAYFAHRMENFTLGPCPALVDVDHPPRYRSFTKQEYFQKLFEKGMGKDRDQLLNSFSTVAQTLSSSCVYM